MRTLRRQRAACFRGRMFEKAPIPCAATWRAGLRYRHDCRGGERANGGIYLLCAGEHAALLSGSPPGWAGTSSRGGTRCWQPGPGGEPRSRAGYLPQAHLQKNSGFGLSVCLSACRPPPLRAHLSRAGRGAHRH